MVLRDAEQTEQVAQLSVKMQHTEKKCNKDHLSRLVRHLGELLPELKELASGSSGC